jgi:hypothetical protein
MRHRGRTATAGAPAVPGRRACAAHCHGV